jgi:hypothetical protein
MQHGTKVAGVLLHALKVNSSHGSESECVEAATKQEHRVIIFAELLIVLKVMDESDAMCCAGQRATPKQGSKSFYG